MDLLLDENIPSGLLALFQKEGHRVKTLSNFKLRGASDEDVFATCKKEGLLLITLDTDFANIRHYPPKTHPGVIVIRVKRQSSRSIMRAMAAFLKTTHLENCRGYLTIIEDSNYRVRKEL